MPHGKSWYSKSICASELDQNALRFSAKLPKVPCSNSVGWCLLLGASTASVFSASLVQARNSLAPLSGSSAPMGLCCLVTAQQSCPLSTAVFLIIESGPMNKSFLVQGLQ